MTGPAQPAANRAPIVSTLEGADPSTITVRLRDLHKIYQLGVNEVHAVRGLNVDIPEGQYISIMGASGSGKSTLLNILGALDVPTKGTYHLAKELTSKLSRDELAALRNKYIGFIFQNFNLLTRSTAVENVELPMVYSGVPTGKRRAAALSALEKVGLADRANHLPSEMSGGQQQRVAIARSLVNNPRVLLADEPTGNLDSHTSGEIMKILDELHQEEGLTIILVTHDPGVAEFTERSIILKDGRIIYDQPTPRVGGPELPDVRTVSLAEA